MNILKENVSNLPQQEHQSVDEQIIAFKDRFSKQYLPDKPHKWGLKKFTLAGISGLVYDLGIFAMGTLRKNRISNLLSDAELKTHGRGSYDPTDFVL